MCGFAGFYCPKGLHSDPSAVLQKMGDAISHRGPDDNGIWFNINTGIAFSHRRLAIIDLTKTGHQPMHSPSKRFTISFNGEIYNHLNLRKDLKNITWKGNSDTETLLCAIEHWGLEKTLQRSTGMFSFALWDNTTHTLTLARDRIGEKPLYYGWQGNSLLFGSDLISFKHHPEFIPEINRQILTGYLKKGYIEAPNSIFENIFKLTPGTFKTFSNYTPKEGVENVYWSKEKVILSSIENPFIGTHSEAVEQLESLLSKAISQQMLADVPLGAFLSGGVDSSTIVSLMQSHSKRPIQTFTIGFNEENYNEAEYAKAVAEHLGTNHTELYVTAQDILNIVPNISKIYSEPFADSSQIPMFLVAKMAKQHVTVALSGDAGDELFYGYSRYNNTLSAWNKINSLPMSLRKIGKNFINYISPNLINKLGLVLTSGKKVYLGDKIHKGAELLEISNFEYFYKNYLLSHYNSTDKLVLNASTDDKNSLVSSFDSLNNQEKMMAIDSYSYLPDDILVKVDRAAMGTSLETRVPMLDHHVVEFAYSLPISYKERDNSSKWPLRQILYKYVPPSLIERPKKGFNIPVRDWLRGPLYEWANDLLDENRIKQEGFFDPIQIQSLWKEHTDGIRNWSNVLWAILMFQQWYQDYNTSN
ncbi:asparagine synthase (glutamine-hydrolyzing) [Photorhabdus asymbiotica]|uniref:asparagine synthase (glutamine-hydrolyzing) n=1 Tax=Photorhabdus asymbiotica TaxID=291112 RepID=UPI003DA74A03